MSAPAGTDVHKGFNKQIGTVQSYLLKRTFSKSPLLRYNVLAKEDFAMKIKDVEYKATLDDFEHRLLVSCINAARNVYLEQGKEIADLDELLIKIIEAPPKKVRVRI